LPLRLICITAHPDDECGAFGGALMRAGQRGAKTSVLCLTEGRAASNRGGARDEDELAQLRRQEFAGALRVLGVDHGEVLTYPDGNLIGQDFFSVTAELVDRIRRFQPHVVLTFGGDGNVNLHQDHTMVSCFATAAFYWAARSNFASGLPTWSAHKLYYGAAPFLAYASPEEARSISLMPASLVLDVNDLKGKKLEAFMQHTTQGKLLSKVREVFERTGGEEKYLLAATRGLPASPMETDMFAGIEE
jgi:LmbE family N-acetylglucosaminyl deacetylase